MRVPVAFGLLALAVTFVSVGASLRAAGWDVTALPRVDGTTGIGAAAKARDPGFHTVQTGAYDGQWYWGIAVDPLATGNVHQSFDSPAYRYSHPLYGWSGWLVSAGQARAAPWSLLVVGLLSMFAAAAAAAELGGRSWAALFVALNPGLVYSASHDLTEPLSAALLLGGLLAYSRGRRAVAIACFGLLVLSKEPYATVPVVLAACEFLKRRARPVESLALAAAVVPAALWWVYVRLRLGHWFTTAGHDAFVTPFAGWKRAIDLAAAHSYDLDPTQNQFGESTLVVFVALAGLLVLTAAVAVVTRSPAALAYLPLFAILACLGAAGTIYERDILRNAAVPLVLVPFILRAYSRGRPD